MRRRCLVVSALFFLSLAVGLLQAERGGAGAAEPKGTFWLIPHTHWEGAVFKTREEYLDPTADLRAVIPHLPSGLGTQAGDECQLGDTAHSGFEILVHAHFVSARSFVRSASGTSSTVACWLSCSARI